MELPFHQCPFTSRGGRTPSSGVHGSESRRPRVDGDGAGLVSGLEGVGQRSGSGNHPRVPLSVRFADTDWRRRGPDRVPSPQFYAGMARVSVGGMGLDLFVGTRSFRQPRVDSFRFDPARLTALSAVGCGRNNPSFDVRPSYFFRRTGFASIASGGTWLHSPPGRSFHAKRIAPSGLSHPALRHSLVVRSCGRLISLPACIFPNALL